MRLVDEVGDGNIVIHAVEQVIVLCAPGSIGCERTACLQAAAVVLRNGDARRQLRQEGSVAPVERQVVDNFLTDQLLDGGALGFKNGSGRGDLNLLRYLTDLQLGIDFKVPLNGHFDLCLHRGLEAWLRDRQGVSADSQGGETETAILTGHLRLLAAGGWFGDGKRCGRHGSSR